MANPQTTHVIEIETGIGEPAFIPLSMGHELQPISVGKKGMWRIESPRVLDVHAFVYFDGNSLFLQSADEQNPASVDGFRVGKAWTELHAPCKIEVGNARLRYRSLLATADEQPTQGLPNAPVAPPPGGPGMGGGPRAGASMPVATAPQAPTRPPPSMTGQRAGVQPPTAPLSFPKAERPFKPGELFSAKPDSESTRIAPLDATSGGGRVSGSHPRPDLNDPHRMPSGAIPAMGGSGQFGSQPMGGPQGSGPYPQQPPQGSGAYGAVNAQGTFPPGSAMMQGSAPGNMPMGYPQQGYAQPQQGYPPQQGSGPYASMPPGMMPPMPGPPGLPQGSMGPGMSYGSMTPGGLTQPAQTPGQQFVEKLKQNSIPKIIAGVLFIIGGILYLAEDDEPQVQPKKRPVATADAGAGEAGATQVAGGAGTTPPVGVVPQNPAAWPAGVPCPPPNWPPNTPLPCVPNNVGIATQTTADPPPTGGKPPKDHKDKDAGAPHLPAGTKTLERQAVDFVAAGDLPKAAAAYEELVRRDPNNKVYAEAARILRGKLDGGVPQ